MKDTMKKIYNEVLLETSIFGRDEKILEDVDFTNLFYIRKLTDDDSKVLKDLSSSIKKFNYNHVGVLADTIKNSYSELISEKNFVGVAQRLIQNLFNGITRTRYFITDNIKFLFTQLWNLLPKSIKDSVKTFYGNYFESTVQSISTFFNNKIIILFGIRMKLSEFLKNMFLLICAGLLIYYIFFKATNKIETPIEEDINKQAFTYIYSSMVSFVECLNYRKKYMKEAVLPVDVPERPTPRPPYGQENAKTAYEKISEFVQSIINDIKKTLTSFIGKLIALLILIPLSVILLIGIRSLVNKLDDGDVKNWLMKSIDSIGAFFKIRFENEKN